jgi:hypothetical protein
MAQRNFPKSAASTRTTTTLVAQWAKDSAADPSKSRFVLAYTNVDVDRLNADIRAVRKERGELGENHSFQTKHGRADFAERDRIQITGTDKAKGLNNGTAGTIESIEGDKIAVLLDGRRGDKRIEFDAKEFKDFRHGYAGTIYKVQGSNLDQTYLYHSEHWRSAASYVAWTRHKDKAELFASHDVAKDVKQLARQMARVDDRRAASHFHQVGAPVPVPELAVRDLPKPEVATWKPEPTIVRPADWAESPGMVAQQQSAMQAVRRASSITQAPAPNRAPPSAPALPVKTVEQTPPPNPPEPARAEPTAKKLPKIEVRPQPPQPAIEKKPTHGTRANVSANFAAPITPEPAKKPEPEKTPQQPAPAVVQKPTPDAADWRSEARKHLDALRERSGSDKSKGDKKDKKDLSHDPTRDEPGGRGGGGRTR